MSNYKRKKPRRFTRCKLCTPRKYVGNQASRDAHGRGRWLDGRRLPEVRDVAEQRQGPR